MPEYRGSTAANVPSIEDLFRLSYILEVRPSPEFAYEAGKRKLVQIRAKADTRSQVSFITPGEEDMHEDWAEIYEVGFTARQGRLLRLSGWVNLESRLSVGCAGAVIAYLSRRRAAVYLPGDVDDGNAFQISAIETFNLKEFM